MPERIVELEQVLPLLQETVSRGNRFRFSPKGTSMRPMLIMGRDSVELIKAPEKLKKYDIPLYRRDDGQFVLHRVVKVGQSYTCIGDNQFVYETGVRPEQILAVVSGFSHNGKHYAVTDLSYRIYCRFWHYSRPVRHLLLRGTRFLKRIFS
ncbi:MAG: S24/S26 family peptidase [Oscillospiraceae bacterium]|nr:S24/S26 family peptidase [Oscillospiraceae bacterium]